MPSEEIVSRLAVLRKKAGLSQVKLAELLDVTPNTIANWEHGRTSLSPFLYISKMCVIFGCPPEDLIRYASCTRSDKPKQQKEEIKKIKANLDELQKKLGVNDSQAVDIAPPLVNE